MNSPHAAILPEKPTGQELQARIDKAIAELQALKTSLAETNDSMCVAMTIVRPNTGGQTQGQFEALHTFIGPIVLLAHASASQGKTLREMILSVMPELTPTDTPRTLN